MSFLENNIVLILGATAVDALAIGYRTILLDDCSRGVDLLEIEKTKNTVIKNNGVIVNSSQVKGKYFFFSLFSFLTTM